MLAISHDGRRGYTANVRSGTVSVLDLGKRRLVTTVAAATVVQRIAISVDDKWVFTADQTKARIVVIDTSTNSVSASIPHPRDSLWHGGDARWQVARHRAARAPDGRGRRPRDEEGRAHLRRLQVPAGSAHPPRQRGSLRLLRRLRRGCRRRPQELEAREADRRGPDGRRACLGSRQVGRARSYFPLAGPEKIRSHWSAIERSFAVRPPSLWVDRARVTLFHRTSMSG